MYLLSYPRLSGVTHRSVVSQCIGMLLAVAVLVVVAGCSSPKPAATHIATPTPTLGLIPSTALPESLFLEIVEPADESVVHEAPLVMVSHTTPDAVVSVGTKTIEVNAQGQFVTLVSLEIGPNLIEVVVSDLTGKQAIALLSVIYIP